MSKIRRKEGLELKKNLPGYLLMAPAVIAVLALSVYPLFRGIYLSFLNYNLVRSNDPTFNTFAGLQNYIDVFTEYVKEGTPVVCICFTPSLSGSYNCACNAREIVCEDYPDAKIAVINSEAGTVSQGLMVIEAGRMCQNGIPYEQCVDILEKMKKTNRIFFTVGNTDYLKHGGRIGKLAGIASSALSLKPLITLVNGEIEASGIGRSRKKTVAKTIALMDDYFKETGDAMEDYSFRVGFGYDIEEGKEYYNTVANHIYGESHVDQVGICQIGATIAVHTGPYAIGIGCVKKYENYLIR